MAETYCGKTCRECKQKEALSCPGCKLGPGKLYSGDCELAKCCREKGHQECITCGFKGNCGTLRSKNYMPEYRRKAMEADRIRNAAIAKRSVALGKWLWVLFWLFLPSTVAEFMTNENLAGSIPVIAVPGQILSALCSFVYGIILIKLTSQEERYCKAGICALVSGALHTLLICFPGRGDEPVWSLLFTLPAAIIALVSQYNEFTAHSIVLTGADNDLSEKWSVLWKWYIGMYGAMLASILVILVIPILGLIITFAAGIGLVVVSVLKLVYLYKTAKVFKTFTAQSPAAPL